MKWRARIPREATKIAFEFFVPQCVLLFFIFLLFFFYKALIQQTAISAFILDVQCLSACVVFSLIFGHIVCDHWTISTPLWALILFAIRNTQRIQCRPVCSLATSVYRRAEQASKAIFPLPFSFLMFSLFQCVCALPLFLLTFSNFINVRLHYAS